jgi:hypothetical protein
VDKSKFIFCSSSNSVILAGNLRRPLKNKISVSGDAHCRCTRPIIERLNDRNKSKPEVFITFGVVATNACYWFILFLGTIIAQIIIDTMIGTGQLKACNQLSLQDYMGSLVVCR